MRRACRSARRGHGKPPKVFCGIAGAVCGADPGASHGKSVMTEQRRISRIIAQPSTPGTATRKESLRSMRPMPPSSNREGNLLVRRRCSQGTRRHPSPARSTSPSRNACASPSGGRTTYLSKMPHLLPSTSICSKRGLSDGVERVKSPAFPPASAPKAGSRSAACHRSAAAVSRSPPSPGQTRAGSSGKDDSLRRATASHAAARACVLRDACG